MSDSEPIIHGGRRFSVTDRAQAYDGRPLTGNHSGKAGVQPHRIDEEDWRIQP
jgi:hypothetical protein